MRAPSTTEDKEAGGLIVRGAGATAFGFVLRFGARLLFLLAAGRLFGAAGFGAYAVAVAVVEVAVGVASLGMKKVLFQLLEERGTRCWWRSPAPGWAR